MSFQLRLVLLLAILTMTGALLFAFGTIDLFVTSWFFDGHDFDWRETGIANFMHDIVHPVAITCGVLASLAVIYCFYRQKSVRVPLFLLVTLVVGPGIITNSILKDHWDRARPIQVSEFGGNKMFTPPLVMANQCVRNCSFVAGDPAMGFWFHSFAYAAPVRRRRQMFVGGLVLGGVYGVLRIGMGAHFLSDVFFAGIVVLITSAVACVGMFGQSRLRECWQQFLGAPMGAPVAGSVMQQQAR